MATDDGVTHVTLNRPRARNAMSQAMVVLLGEALEAAESNGTRVLVLRGEGGHFCAGGDIKDMAKARGADVGDVDPVAELNAGFGRIALRFARSPLPVVAVVEGAVMGGGFGLACIADVVIASTTADFRLPETSLGVVPAQIAPFLVERLGYSEAKRLALTGARLGAERALGLGLVHEVAEPADLDGAVSRTVAEILRCAPLATAATKRLFHRLHPGVDGAAIEHAATVFAAAARGDEAVEGMTAFMSKRAPAWAPS
ncbi:MAG: enoyl-CoA hydratase/isomerase family protein [Sandaracinaceae bacterium]